MSENGKVLSALLLGAAAGAVLGLLLAPEKGSDTRKKIRTGADDLIDQLSEKIQEGKDALYGLKNRATSMAEDLKDKAKSKAESLKSDGEDELNSLKNKGKQMANSYNQ